MTPSTNPAKQQPGNFRAAGVEELYNSTEEFVKTSCGRVALPICNRNSDMHRILLHPSADQ